jgi:hypothetical protein
MRLFRLGCVLVVAGVLLTGCGGKSASPPSAKATAAAPAKTPAPKATPTPLTSPADLAACAPLEQAVSAVSALVGHTTEAITKALHTKELADRMGTAQQSLLDSAKLIDIVDAPKPLVAPQQGLEQGLRMFAADFGRAKVSAAAGDVNKASDQTVDEKALRKIQTSAKKIDDLCGA